MNLIDRMDRAIIRSRIAISKPFEQAGPIAPHAAPSRDPEEGSTTVEYAIGAVATAGLAGLLVVVLKSGGVKSLIQGLIESALTL